MLAKFATFRTLVTSALVGALLGAGLVGCSQNPIPPGLFKPAPDPKPTPVLPPYVLELPRAFEFVAGQKATYQLKAAVPKPAKAIVSVTDLPPGVKFNPSTYELNWTPDYAQAIDPSNAQASARFYTVHFTLASSLDALTTITRDATFLVRAVPREFSIDFGSTPPPWNFKEGQTADSQVFSFNAISDDFPGKLKVKLATPLPGATDPTPDSSDPSKWTFTYNPDFTVANLNAQDIQNDSNGYYKLITVDFLISGPNLHVTDQSVQIKVYDVRQAPVLVVPDNIKGSDLYFNVSAEDLNGEVAPTITIDPAPTYGKLDSIQQDQTGQWKAFPTTMSRIHFYQIPVAKMGTSDTLNIKACTTASPGDSSNCTSAQVQVSFTGQVHPPPTIDRTAWPLGTADRIQAGKSLSVSLPIADAEANPDSYDDTSPIPAPTVTIQPDSAASQVTWSNNQLTVTPTATGIMQFNVVATSAFGVVQTESFLVKVLPANWSQNLIVGDTLGSPGVVFAQTLWPGAQVVNPELQTVDDDMVALRNNVMILTNGLWKPDLTGAAVAAAQIPNALILSPLVADLASPTDGTSNAFTQEIQGYNLSFVGRYPKLPKVTNAPLLKNLSVEVAQNSGLTAPTKPVTLAGKATSESAHPEVIDASNSSNCNTILSLKGTGATANQEYSIAVKCTRTRSDGSTGTLILSGFDWNDFVFQKADDQLGITWLKQLLGTN